MSRRNDPNIDLKMNLSPPRLNNPRVNSPSRSATVSPTSSLSSCVSCEIDVATSSNEATSSMVLVRCPRCIMYVMLSEDDPKCPKCNNIVLLDFLHDTATSTSTITTKTRNNH